VINGGGLVYTVDEVSDLLEVPRPTLYRYLKEYSVPYERRAGRISIPEEALGRIRRIRELHDEGLGTEAVRRRLRGRDEPDTDLLAERLDRLSEVLERARAAPQPSAEMLSSHALRLVLARQSLLISAVFNMTEMLEELLAANGRPRREVFDDAGREIHAHKETSLELLESSPDAGDRTVPLELPAAPILDNRFGTMARRRRRGALAILLVLSLGLLVTWAALAFDLTIV
jgi:DNA-binding transcriptional MerR regulator